MTKTNGNTITWRVTILEKEVCGIDEKVDSILQNHLPHLQNEILELKTKINVLSVINIGAIVLALLINRYL